MKNKYHSLEVIEIDPRKGNPNVSVILLHGLGGRARDLSAVSHVWRLKRGVRPRWILPQAPNWPVTINNGQVMPAWYDILSVDMEHRVDYATFQGTYQQLHGIIEQELVRGIAAEQIILAGFSQGGAVALELMLRYPKCVAGVVCLSGYLLNKDNIAAEKVGEHKKNVPIFYAHGELDQVVPYPLATASKDLLVGHGYKLTWRSYRKLGHFVNNREILDIKRWVDDVILTEEFISNLD